MGQLTLCPSGRNSPEPGPNLAPSDSPVSGRHGFTIWGHDAKFIKIGVIPTGGLLGQGKANGSQDRKQDLGPLSKCTTCNLGQASRKGIEIWDRQLTTWGAKIGVPKRGHFGCSK